MPSKIGTPTYHDIAEALCKVHVPLTVKMIQGRFKIYDEHKVQNALANIDKSPDYHVEKDRTGAFRTYIVTKVSQSRKNKLWRLALFGEPIQ